ncbi:hypothetical protein [Flavobacterium hercynium]|uniref:Uncharacterized protein n=1 Tax=Flavobacterium hercynium TaxID=387094 RepID=A0A226HIJ2_9FLAO|nr:hypothetical protein [Flavobacterium hercynium]OXA93982.1 hypothetical protein B0A66_05640 [Flavobacterium hercynium]SMP36625.1 hypothetical protein SAMN06265346_12323 [Flavobacterium hercynium]
MSINITGIIIDAIPNDTNQNFDENLEYDCKISKIKSLSPKSVSISFVNECTLILLDKIFIENVDEEDKLTDLENDIVQLFPNNDFWIFVMNDTIDFFGYSLIKKGIKTRTKFLGQGKILLDFGDLIPIENKIYEDYYEIILGDKESENSFNKTNSNLSEIQKKKALLMLKDRLLEKINSENEYPYLSGKIESLYIENILNIATKKEVLDLLDLNFAIFNKAKFNFKNESLKNYILIAQSRLLKQNLQ